MKEIFKEIQRINKNDPAIASERLCKVFEEAGELAQEINKTIGRKSRTETPSELKDMICEEAADTIQCIISLIDTYGITYKELIEKLKNKNMKWESAVEQRLKSEAELENLKEECRKSMYSKELKTQKLIKE